MGSSMRRAVFTDRVAQGLKNWHKKAKQSLSKTNSISSRHSASLRSKTSDNSVRGSVESMHNRGNEDMHSAVVMSPPPSTNNNSGSGEEEERIAPTHEQEISSVQSTSEITTVEEDNPEKIITRVTYDGEISFGSSWKNMGSSRGIGEIISIAEEDDTDKLPDLVP